MAALTDLSDLINRQSGGNNGTPNNMFFHKVARVAGAAAPAPVAGRSNSVWTFDGMPAGGAVPTSAAITDRMTQGALPIIAPGEGRDLHLIGASVLPQIAGVYLLYDRLFHVGGLSGTSTSAQTVQGSPASPALTRYTDGVGNMAWYEIYSLLGTTATTLTMNYTNQAGTSGQTATVNIGSTNNREVTRAQRIPLAAGDTGIRAISTVTLAASTTTAGNFGITIAQPLAWIPVGSTGMAGWRDYTTGMPGIPTIHPDACLAWLYTPLSGSAPEIWGCLSTVEK
jgi:hypothetical protein